MEFSNKDITYWHGRLPDVKKRLKSNKLKMNRLLTQIKKDESILYKFEWGAFGKIEHYNGKWLDVHEYETIYGVDCKINPMSDTNARHAEIYQNCSDNKKWGGHLKTYSTGVNRDIFLGANWNYRDIVEVGKRWVATGKLPALFSRKDLI